MSDETPSPLSPAPLPEHVPTKAPKPEPKPPAPIHGGILFVLMVMPGFLLGCGLVALIGVATRDNTRGGGDTFSTLLSVGGAGMFIGSIVVGTAFKRWGWSGVMMGACLPVTLVAMIAAICGGGRSY